jgi:hypothetical protein
MTCTAKITVVLLCFALCGAGTFVASTVRQGSNQSKRVNAIPVNNHEVMRRVWIEV